ncbi:MAG TPA: hypothetical protein VJ932_06545, partial [Alkalispirochaeta sp.]|nr:hypothetical protein [Alkalispirochaeta sp.]
MSLGRGGAAIGIVIAALLIVSVGVAVMLLATQREEISGSGGVLPDAAPAPSAETRQLTPSSETTTSDSGGDAGAETASPAAGSPLDGPLAARMARWHP